MPDELSHLRVAEVAAWYRRLADLISRRPVGRGAASTEPLASLFLRHYLDNRDANSTFSFTAPDYLKTNSYVGDALAHHRRVFLTEEQAHGSSRWAGVIPRIQGGAGFSRWNLIGQLSLNYQSLVELPIYLQLTGSDEEKDLLYALHGFQLRSDVQVSGARRSSSSQIDIRFMAWNTRVIDRYDWDYSEHFTVPNPDYQSTNRGAVAPRSREVVVYHRNARRLEEANLAAPYNIESAPWAVTNSNIVRAGVVDGSTGLDSWWPF